MVLENRIIFPDEGEQELAEQVLEDQGLDYDYDSKDRMMVDEDGLEALEEEGVDFDQV